MVVSGRRASGKTQFIISLVHALGQTTRLGKVVLITDSNQAREDFSFAFDGLYLGSSDMPIPDQIEDMQPHPLNVLIIEDVTSGETLRSPSFWNLVTNSGPNSYNLLTIVSFQTVSTVPLSIVSSATHFATLGPYHDEPRMRTYKYLLSVSHKPKRDVLAMMDDQDKFEAIVLDIKAMDLRYYKANLVALNSAKTINVSGC